MWIWLADPLFPMAATDLSEGQFNTTVTVGGGIAIALIGMLSAVIVEQIRSRKRDKAVADNTAAVAAELTPGQVAELHTVVQNIRTAVVAQMSRMNRAEVKQDEILAEIRMLRQRQDEQDETLAGLSDEITHPPPTAPEEPA